MDMINDKPKKKMKLWTKILLLQLGLQFLSAPLILLFVNVSIFDFEVFRGFGFLIMPIIISGFVPIFLPVFVRSGLKRDIEEKPVIILTVVAILAIIPMLCVSLIATLAVLEMLGFSGM
jgi:hypothetical protein